MAKEHPRYAGMEWPEPEFSEYPKMVYPKDKDPTVPAHLIKKLPPGKAAGPNQGVLVENQAEEELVMGGGAIHHEVDQLEDLRQKLRTLDPTVQIDKRWGATKLQGLIDDAEAKLNE